MSAYSLEGKRIYVAGHRGMVGSALVRALEGFDDVEILTATHKELDLLRQKDVEDFVKTQKPHAILIAAAKVGGIAANNEYPADFIYENIAIETNLIKAAADSDVEKLLFLGSSCIYPKFAEQPIKEEALLSGPLEPTNEWYAIAKIAGIKMCEAFRKQYGKDFISAMPTNLYGPGDNFDLETSHVMPALIRKAHEAKTSGADKIIVWGTGKPRREFMHVDDCAAATIFLLQHYSDARHINIGYGDDIAISDLVTLICRIVGFQGEIIYDTNKPDGTPRKLMDSSRLNAMGWFPNIGLKEGVNDAYVAFLQSV